MRFPIRPSIIAALGVASLAPNADAAAAIPAQASNCIETVYMSDNGGALGGAVYFDLEVFHGVTVSGLRTNYGQAPGTPVGVEVWTIPGTYVGNASSSAGWTLAATDDGTAVSAGDDNPTAIRFMAVLGLPPGAYGVALVAVNAEHEYTNAIASSPQYSSLDGVLRLTWGSADNVPFSGAMFTPRLWNGTLCHDSGPVGARYCASTANSSGGPAALWLLGSDVATDNDLTLVARRVPTNSFGYFLNGTAPAQVWFPGGSAGVLCLGGQLGRYVRPGEVQSTGPSGMMRLELDLTRTPSAAGTVAITAGQTWYFQGWYRDAVGAAATSNLTSGVSVAFQ